MHPGIRACFCLLVGQEGDKEADLPEWCKAFEFAAASISELVNLAFSHQTGFSNTSIHYFIDSPMVLTEPTVSSAQLLGLGSKLYPYGNKQHICSTKILLA